MKAEQITLKPEVIDILEKFRDKMVKDALYFNNIYQVNQAKKASYSDLINFYILSHGDKE